MPPRVTKEATRFPLHEVDTPLSASVQKQLLTVLHQREMLEETMAEVDLRVYELETTYLGLCVELGGSLFDGFGLERSSLVHSGGTSGSPRSRAPVLGPTPGSPTTVDGARGFPASPLVAGEEDGVSGVGGSGSVLSGVAGNILSSNLAFRARVHAFSPAERVFSSSSIGAIGRVERLKASGRTSSSGVSHSSSATLHTPHASATAPGSKSLWTSAGRRRRARAAGAEEADDDAEESLSTSALSAQLYTTTGRRKRARPASQDDDDSGTGSKRSGGRRGSAH